MTVELFLAALEIAGVNRDTVSAWIKKHAAKKVLVHPTSIKVPAGHRESRSFVVVQNKTDDPLFDVQIACLPLEGQEVKISPRDMRKMESMGPFEVDTTFINVFGILPNGQKVYVLEFSCILPGSSFEIDLKFKGGGEVGFQVVHFNEVGGRVLNIDENQYTGTFIPPFDLTLQSITLWGRRSHNQ